MTDYQARLVAPFGVLGIYSKADVLTGIEFLAPGTKPQSPTDLFTKIVCEQLLAYFSNPLFHFDLPFLLNGSAHQIKVWHAICAISCGQTKSYGELSRQLNSSPRAVGQACGSNPIAVVIPCHRVVSKASMGGFIRQSVGGALDIKRWLLMHEAVAFSDVQGKNWGKGMNAEPSLSRLISRKERGE